MIAKFTILATPPPWAPAHGRRDRDNVPEVGTPVMLSLALVFALMRRIRN